MSQEITSFNPLSRLSGRYACYLHFTNEQVKEDLAKLGNLPKVSWPVHRGAGF